MADISFCIVEKTASNRAIKRMDLRIFLCLKRWILLSRKIFNDALTFPEKKKVK